MMKKFLDLFVDVRKRFSAVYVVAFILIACSASTLYGLNSVELKELETLASKKKDKDAQLRLGKIYYLGEEAPADYKQAEKWLKKASDNGVAEADYILGCMYLQGKTGKVEEKKAIKYLEKSSNAWYPEAQFLLGSLYENGKIVDQNMETALVLYTNAANGGLLQAQKLLGEKYEKGQNVPKDMQKSLEWKEKAANNGASEYYALLGNEYLEGKNIVKNIDKAIDFFKKADASGDKTVQQPLGMIYMNDGPRPNLEEAAKWLEKAADLGHPENYLLLGKKYFERGDDHINAFKFLSLASDNNFTEANPMLGLLYFYGAGAFRNTPRAIRLFNTSKEDPISAYSLLLAEDLGVEGAPQKIVTAADYEELASKSTRSISQNFSDFFNFRNFTASIAKTGNEHAAYSMGNLNRFFFNDKNLMKSDNDVSALEYYSNATNEGLAQAMDFLGECHYDGIGTYRDYEKAAQYFRRAAEKGLPRGQYHLGVVYETGNGVEANEEEAKKWYGMAAASGDTYASKALSRISIPSFNIADFAKLIDNDYSTVSACKKVLTPEMEKFGFNFKTESNREIEEADPYDDDVYIRYNVKCLEYSNGRITIDFFIRDWGTSQQIFMTTIDYPDKGAADKFVESSKTALGSLLTKSGNDYMYNLRKDYYYGVNMQQEGSRITLNLYYDD